MFKKLCRELKDLDDEGVLFAINSIASSDLLREHAARCEICRTRINEITQVQYGHPIIFSGSPE
jgi:hypothetical protein